MAEALPARTRADQDLQGLYERHADRIFGFCRSRLRSHQEAEDATQTTFLHAFRALQRGAVPVSETAWLFKIAENVCHSVHRTNGRRSEHELADGADIIELAPAREKSAEALVGLEEALATIPESQRRAFVLRELRGLSYKEIASAIGVSVTSVEMLVFRARRSLARALEGGSLRGRVASLLDLGAVLNVIKTAFGGATAVKVASAAVAVAIATVPAADSGKPKAAVSPTKVETASVERPRATADAPARATRRAPSRAQTTPGLAKIPAPPVASDHTRRGGLPRPGRLGTEPPTADVPTPADAPPATATPAAPQTPSLPVTEPPVEAPVEVPTAPQMTAPSVPQLPVEVPALPELPVELPVELPETPELEVPELPKLP